MICKHILLITFLNEPDLVFLCTELNGFKYCYLTPIIPLNITQIILLHTVKRF